MKEPLLGLEETNERQEVIRSIDIHLFFTHI
jgi:hypothetical protein